MYIVPNFITSTLDYPGGHLSTTVFTKGCNLRCGYCHNAELINKNPEECLSSEEFIDLIKERRSSIPYITVSGGEPTIHEDLPEVLRQLKTLGFKVKLDTNGSHPEMLKQIISENLVTYVAMDLKTSLAKYIGMEFGWEEDSFPEDILTESARALSLSGISHEYRTTFFENYLGLVDIKNIQKILLQNYPSTQHPVVKYFVQWGLWPHQRKTPSKYKVRLSKSYLPDIVELFSSCKDVISLDFR
jgi:pyruvate formate lyase activating enzyme